MNAKLFMLHCIVSINENITMPCSKNTVLLCSPADLWSNQRIRWTEVRQEIHPVSKSPVWIRLAQEIQWDQPWERMSAFFWSQPRCELQRKRDEKGEEEGGMKAEKGEQLSFLGVTRPADVSRQWYRDEGGEDVPSVSDKRTAQNLLTFSDTFKLWCLNYPKTKSLLFFRSLTQ